MRSAMPLVGALGLALAALALLADPADADSGDGGATIDSYGTLEAEKYDVPTGPGCDPDGDGEHPKAQAAASSSNGRQAFIPSSGCSIFFLGLDFPESGVFDSLRAYIGGSTSSRTVKLSLFVDGWPVGTGTLSQTGAPAYAEVPITSAVTVAAGAHDLRVLVEVTSGATWHNTHIDCLRFGGVGTCVQPPFPKPAFTVEYAQACDQILPIKFTDKSLPGATFGVPETITDWEWDFGDDSMGSGPDVEHTYKEPGEYTVTLTVTNSAGYSASASLDVTVEVEPCPTPTTPPQGGSAGHEPPRDGVDEGYAGADHDGDGVANNIDGCPDRADPEQTDLDGDGVGDACDPDADGDGVQDRLDSCPGVADASNVDADGDGAGDACDAVGGGAGLESCLAGDACLNGAPDAADVPVRDAGQVEAPASRGVIPGQVWAGIVLLVAGVGAAAIALARRR